MNDGMRPEQPNEDIVLTNVLDGRATADLGEKGIAIDNTSIRVGVQEILREIRTEPGDVGFIDGPYVISVQRERPDGYFRPS